MSRSDYTTDEKYKILKHIIDNKQYTTLRGKASWKKMEKDKICARTWQSMKNHFKMKLIQNLHLFPEIPQKEKDNILKGYNSTATVKLTKYGRKIRLPIFNTSFSDDEIEEPNQPVSTIDPVESDNNEVEDVVLQKTGNLRISDCDESFSTIPVNEQLSAPIRIPLSCGSEEMYVVADNNIETNQHSMNKIEIPARLETSEVQMPSKINKCTPANMEHPNKTDQSVQVKTYSDASIQCTPYNNEVLRTSDFHLGANNQMSPHTLASLKSTFRANISAANYIIKEEINGQKITRDPNVPGLASLCENLRRIAGSFDGIMLEGGSSSSEDDR